MACEYTCYNQPSRSGGEPISIPPSPELFTGSVALAGTSAPFPSLTQLVILLPAEDCRIGIGIAASSVPPLTRKLYAGQEYAFAALAGQTLNVIAP